MNQPNKPIRAESKTETIPLLNNDELSNLTKFLDILLEINMDLKRNKETVCL